MTSFLYGIVELIARIHTALLSVNDGFEQSFTDKELHFLVIGMLGMVLIFVIHPLFLALAKTEHVMVISWIYVFTVLVVITFAIEIGQKLTGTGNMEFADITFGLFGFFVMFFIFAVLRAVVKAILWLLKR